jgi:flagellar hook-associated protein 3 FlgL
MTDIYTLNEQIASGQRINKPSDDPVGIARAMDYEVEIAAQEQYLANIDGVTSVLSYTDTVLNSVNESLTSLSELAVQAASDTTSESSRDALAAEAGQIRDQLLSLANSKFSDTYIFSGFKTDAAAFDGTYAYQGDAGTINIAVGSDVLIAQNVSGQAAFQYEIDSEQVIEIEDGTYAHYTSSGGTVTVEITDSETSGGTVLDTFTFDNAMEMADVLCTAIDNDDTLRVSALISCVEDMAEQVNNVRADIGARLNRLDDQASRLEEANLQTETSLSSVRDVDLVEAASELAQAETALSAIQAATAKIISQSLLDFLS